MTFSDGPIKVLTLAGGIFSAVYYGINNYLSAHEAPILQRIMSDEHRRDIDREQNLSFWISSDQRNVFLVQQQIAAQKRQPTLDEYNNIQDMQSTINTNTVERDNLRQKLLTESQ